MIYNVYTDGSCNQGSVMSANTNGGWAFIVVDDNESIVFSESAFESNTTNNRAEMLAIIKSIDFMSNKGFFEDSNNLMLINCDNNLTTPSWKLLLPSSFVNILCTESSSKGISLNLSSSYL